jgi:glutamine amidotransferase
MPNNSNSNIVIIDYGSGNLRSVANALELVKTPKQQVLISAHVADLKSASHIILPGVGAFGDCMEALRAIPGMIAEINQQVKMNHKPFLGICVGMQLLADIGFEYGQHQGLGLIPGQVTKLTSKPNLKIPHIGWNNLHFHSQHPILQDIDEDEHAYFVHSYHFITDPKYVVASCNYGQEIVAIIAKNNIIATQFHPEKSAAMGLQLLKNFIELT